MSKISKWFKDRAASVGHNIGDRMADKIYQSCLLDCVDDWDRVRFKCDLTGLDCAV